MLRFLTLMIVVTFIGLSSCKKEESKTDPAYCSNAWATAV